MKLEFSLDFTIQMLQVLRNITMSMREVLSPHRERGPHPAEAEGVWGREEGETEGVRLGGGGVNSQQRSPISTNGLIINQVLFSGQTNLCPCSRRA